MHKQLVLVAGVLLLFASTALAEMQTKEIEYFSKQGENVLQGYMAWDETVKGKRPGVLVVHEWWGHNEHARNQAKRLAEAGYVAFALDMYGKGKASKNPEDAKAWSNEVRKDPALLLARFNAALDQLKKDPHVAPDQIAAIGYCFGGAVVLDAARSGADLDAVVSFHGALATKTPAEPGKIKAWILVLTGGADPYVSAEQVEAFTREMKAAGAKFQVVSYPGVKHSFTNTDAGNFGMDALEYNAEADQKSFAAMLELFKEVFR